MAKPFNNFEFATDANYATGPDAGTPTKVAPSAGEIDSGFVRGTAAVAQHMNWLFGEVQDWTDYLAGLSSDSEFLGDLEARDWAFGGEVSIAEDLHVTGVMTALGLTTTGNISVGAGIGATGNISTNGNLSAQGTLSVTGNTTLNGDLTLGAGDNITMASRTIDKQIPITGFSQAIQFNSDWSARSYVGGGTAGYGFNLFGDKAAGSYIFPHIEFTIPTGATLIAIDVQYKMSQGAGNANFGPMTLDRVEANTVSTSVTSDIAPAFTNASSTADNHHLFTVTSPVASTKDTRYRFIVEPSSTSDSGDPDCIHGIFIRYTTTHVNEND